MMIVHTPKWLKGTKGNVAIIELHGGGGIGGSPDLSARPASHMARSLNCIVFNPEYTLAAKGGGKITDLSNDLYSVLKEVINSADKYGIDKDKIVVHGNSGGGWACTVLSATLAVKNESHLIKFAIANQFVNPAWYIKTDKKKVTNSIVKQCYYDGPIVAQALAVNFDQ